jgi:hypothetical protein
LPLWAQPQLVKLARQLVELGSARQSELLSFDPAVVAPAVVLEH